jgi:hypothetical protein
MGTRGSQAGKALRIIGGLKVPAGLELGFWSLELFLSFEL